MGNDGICGNVLLFGKANNEMRVLCFGVYGFCRGGVMSRVRILFAVVLQSLFFAGNVSGGEAQDNSPIIGADLLPLRASDVPTKGINPLPSYVDFVLAVESIYEDTPAAHSDLKRLDLIAFNLKNGVAPQDSVQAFRNSLMPGVINELTVYRKTPSKKRKNVYYWKKLTVKVKPVPKDYLLWQLKRKSKIIFEGEVFDLPSFSRDAGYVAKVRLSPEKIRVGSAGVLPSLDVTKVINSTSILAYIGDGVIVKVSGLNTRKLTKGQSYSPAEPFVAITTWEYMSLIGTNKVLVLIPYSQATAGLPEAKAEELFGKRPLIIAKDIAEPEEKDKPRVKGNLSEEQIVEQTKRQFSSYDGSHYKLVRKVRSMIYDPGTFEHIRTEYEIKDDHILISMHFRHRPKGKMPQKSIAQATVDFEGNIIKIDGVEK